MLKKKKYISTLFVITILCYPFNLLYAQQSGYDVKYNTENKKSENAPTLSLTDYIQENEPQTDSEDGKKTWINSLVDKVSEKVTSSTSDTEIIQHRSNASVFDVSGVMLRMNAKQASEVLEKRGYRKTAEKLEIPNFIRWRYEEDCRNQGVVGSERLASCVIRMSRKNNYQYIQNLTFNNFQTKETVDIFFTSNFTGNKVYRVMYSTDAANIKGSGAKADYLRNIKIFDFWKKINQKYGQPDNKEKVTWGLGDRKPFLQAQTGRLVLYDPMLLELDYARMSREDQKFLNTAVYTF